MKYGKAIAASLIATGLTLSTTGAAAQDTTSATAPTARPIMTSPSVTPVAQTAELINIAHGGSAVITMPAGLSRVSIANPEIADAVVVSETEVVINGKMSGATSLLIWNTSGEMTLYTVRVTADANTLQSEYARLYPDEAVEVSAVGNSVVLTGQVTDAVTRRQMVALAETLGEEVQVLDHLGLPDQGQVLLKVRFAEVSRNAMQSLGVNVLHADPANRLGDDEIGMAVGSPSFSGNYLDGSGPEQTFSDAVNFFIFNDEFKIGALINALRGNGMFKSLAEPNLLALPGEEATFLAGGEFPIPVVQGGAGNNAVTVLFKEFGIRLAFTPEITNSGSIKLDVAPEVSALDFANGLQLSGFRIPALTSRKAHTVVELKPGQTFAIAGLMDNQLVESVNKVPLLGDIPILGHLFRSTDMQQSRTELLVLVTPELVRPMNSMPELPTGEVDTWDGYNLGDEIPADTTGMNNGN